MKDLIKYLKETGYSAGLIEKAEKLHILFKSELADLLSKFDFEDYFIEFMIEHPDSISTIKYRCEYSGGITKSFIDEWNSYHI